MIAKRKPKKAALVLTGDDRAVLSSLPDDERAIVEDTIRRHAGLTAGRGTLNWNVRAGCVIRATAIRARGRAKGPQPGGMATASLLVCWFKSCGCLPFAPDG